MHAPALHQWGGSQDIFFYIPVQAQGERNKLQFCASKTDVCVGSKERATQLGEESQWGLIYLLEL